MKISSLAVLIAGLFLVPMPPALLNAQQVADTSNDTKAPRVRQPEDDFLRDMQTQAIESNSANWGHWGANRSKFSSWTTHSNRLVPVYTFGISLESVRGERSVYRDAAGLEALYGRVPESTVDANADYFDQTDVYRLQQAAVAQGKRFVVLLVFDGMDWDTTRAAAIYRTRAVQYDRGRGSGLSFQDYDKTTTDFGAMVCSPFNNSTQFDVNGQVILGRDERNYGGYNALRGGYFPWDVPENLPYLISLDRTCPHAYTDSAASATSICSGIKSYNGAINVDPDGNRVIPIARELQQQGFAVGLISSVPISHATPASAYANNVSRSDYQDLTRDLLGLPSIANRRRLPGVDVLLGSGWQQGKTADIDAHRETGSQGINFVPGNRYLAESDWDAVDINASGKYHVVKREPGQPGGLSLMNAAEQARQNGGRLFGFFGTEYGHLPYQTANGDFQPARGISNTETYDESDISENPTLAEMTRAALTVLETNQRGFWLMIEPGDVDWANHNNNIDDAIGAVYSGEAAFDVICQWAEQNQCWDETAVIVTADHGHLFVLTDPQALTGRPTATRPPTDSEN